MPGYLTIFQSVISPTILFGLSEVALTRLQLQKLDSIFKRMLRSIVGWVRLESDTWHETMSRMKVRVDRALGVFPIEVWSTQVMRHQFRLDSRVATDRLGWAAKCIEWHPRFIFNDAYRCPGRPRRRWDDLLSAYVLSKCGANEWIDAFRLDVNGFFSEDDFVAFPKGHDVDFFMLPE